jgi:hypothetical protein
MAAKKSWFWRFIAFAWALTSMWAVWGLGDGLGGHVLASFALVFTRFADVEEEKERRESGSGIPARGWTPIERHGG